LEQISCEDIQGRVSGTLAFTSDPIYRKWTTVDTVYRIGPGLWDGVEDLVRLADMDASWTESFQA
jgi:hypothetical protein